MVGGLRNENHSLWGPCWGIWQGAHLLGTSDGSGDGHLSPQGLC